MAIFNLKAWQGSAWTSLLLSYYGTRKVRLETLSCYGTKKILFGLISMELEAVIIPIIAKRDRGAIVAVHQPSCVDAVFLLTFARP